MKNDFQKNKLTMQNAQTKINQAIALIASLSSTIEQYLPDTASDPDFLARASNNISDVIDRLREINVKINNDRFSAIEGPFPIGLLSQEKQPAGEKKE